MAMMPRAACCQYLLLCCLSSSAEGQYLFADRENYWVETQALAATNRRLPLWLTARQFGALPALGPGVSVQAGLVADYLRPTHTRTHLRPRGSDFGYGLRVAGYAGQENGFSVNEAYLKGRTGSIEGVLGRRREVAGLADTALGMGPVAFSGQARPIWKARLGTAGYVSLAQGFVGVNAFLSFGFLPDPAAFVPNARFHQKALYLRFGPQEGAFQVLAGINHQVQFGGRAPALAAGGVLQDLPEKENYFQPDGSLPARGPALWSVLTGLRTPVGQPPYNGYDAHERVGNHVGSIDAGLVYHTDGLRLMAYRQQMLDRASLLKVNNMLDALTGITLQFSPRPDVFFQVRRITAEWLYTGQQGRRGHWVENYFNHEQYLQGWAYRGRPLGTPFVPPAAHTLPGLPRAWWLGQVPHFSNANRASVLHSALAGTVGYFGGWETRVSYGTYKGSFPAPFARPVGQWSLLARYEQTLREGLEVSVRVGADIGRLYAPTYGLMLGLRRSWGLVQEDISDLSRYRLRNGYR